MTDLSPEPTLTDLNPVFSVGSIDYESKLQEDLFINRTDLSEEFCKHPERFAFYATCYELAAAKAESLKIQLERLYAMLDHEKRSELLMAGVKTTEKMVENSVITDDRYIAMQTEGLEASRNAAVLKAAMHAMQHRKDMLVQLGSAARAELQADISIKAAHAKSSNT
jgi:hypothetical protein